MDYHIEVKRAGGRSRHFRGCIPNEDWSRLLEFREALLHERIAKVLK